MAGDTCLVFEGDRGTNGSAEPHRTGRTTGAMRHVLTPVKPPVGITLMTAFGVTDPVPRP